MALCLLPIHAHFCQNINSRALRLSPRRQRGGNAAQESQAGTVHMCTKLLSVTQTSLHSECYTKGNEVIHIDCSRILDGSGRNADVGRFLT